ncbi:sugar transferase [Maribacter aestuarii]|uniref:sugar transferase n=1 Tax=Maribacter aestuarii TaxID=1130723 RepID=UPI00248D0C82|nr:sugar transferase [Maribacter aestuarii]
MPRIYPIVKRSLDFFTALLVLVVFSPIILLIFVMLLFANEGKPFFQQQRPGRHKKVFTINKFKTMNDKKDASGKLLPDGKRLTPIGIIIRKTSLDELPQLFNVLKGDMSFVGPRPLLVRYLPFYTKEEELRHTVRPGISGLAQVSGRNTVKWDDRLKLDIEYVENLSFWLDMKILLLTVLRVIQSKDVSVDPTVLMPALDVERSIKMESK